MKILIATEKPFAPAAIDKIRSVVELQNIELTVLEKYRDTQDFIDAIHDVDALIVRSDKVTAEVLSCAKNLKIVVRAGAGYDNLDLEACSKYKIVAMNTPGQNANAVAELAIGMMIYMARNQFNKGAGTEVAGKTLGIHAYGNVGRIVAKNTKALGMNVLVFDPFLDDKILEEGVIRVDTAKELYQKSQYLSLHIPANEQTIGSIGYDLVSIMPQGATLVNTARREVIDEQGLFQVMSEREDIKYVTDIAPKQDFACFDSRFFATPKKMGAQTQEANINAGVAAVTQIVEYLKNNIIKYQLNKF